ncbi:MAG: efflux RND transporter periplasmic adaptor subunit [Steroidobacteraceae bacterium]
MSRSAKNCPLGARSATRAIALLGGLPATVLLAGCGATQPKQAAQAPLVQTVTVQPQQVPLTEHFVGRLSAYREANVLARVAGVLLKRQYKEGTEVHAGQPLFLIDPAPYRAALDADLAALSEARANAANAAVTLQRDRTLIGPHLISQSQFDTDQAAARSTAALVQQAEANVESARINLGYTNVTSPITGIAGEQQVTEGALVGQGTATLLTTVDQINPIYVNFNEPAAQQEQLTAQAQAGRVTLAGPKAPVQLLLSDGTDYGQPGELDFRAASVDPSTGTIALRGRIPNPHGHLLPGMFVQVRLSVGVALKAYLVPQAAVERDSNGAAYVLTVNGGDIVEKKPVETEGTSGSDWIVWRGLVAGERVIVAGIQSARPGAKVVVRNGPAAAQAQR